MWHSNKFLSSCQKLNQLGYPLILEPGSHIARGYADLGFEQFLYLAGSRTISLFSGQVSPLPEEHHKFFFAVPTSDQLLQALLKLPGAKLERLEFVESRIWQLKISCNKAHQEFTDPILEELLIAGYGWVRSLDSQ